MNLKCFFGRHDWIVFQSTTCRLKYRECQRCGRRDHWFEIAGIRGHWFNTNAEIARGLSLAGMSLALAALAISLVNLHKKYTYAKEKACSASAASSPTSATSPIRCEMP